MDKFKAVDKFRYELVNEFLSLCDYNDFNQLSLEEIANTINDVYEKCIDDMVTEDEN